MEHDLGATTRGDIEQAFRAHSTELYRLARSNLAGDSVAADDVIQDAFVRLIRSAFRYPVGDIRPILYRIVRNLLKDRAKAARVRRQAEPHLRLVAPDACELTPERIIMGRDKLTRVEQAILALPPKCRQVYVLARMEHMSNADIAQHCGTSISNVEKHMTKALGRLSQALREDGA
ncbi:RNA polymerase sigma factor [Sphingobium sp.]|uniref:RNA polymerase sigma factor n=1 Tax=Sphingobium sp. TaxID=1912891 RepID=UPI002C81CE1A|nr:RNA polymerase sigma factor [Sphingobium sp.]HUD92897.1 RNA polymerase sigma factor [Sphingobium sp.]